MLELLLLRRQRCIIMREALEQGLYTFDAQLGSNATPAHGHGGGVPAHRSRCQLLSE